MLALLGMVRFYHARLIFGSGIDLRKLAHTLHQFGVWKLAGISLLFFGELANELYAAWLFALRLTCATRKAFNLVVGQVFLLSALIQRVRAIKRYAMAGNNTNALRNSHAAVSI